MEDAYFTLSYSPVRSEAGRVAGMLVVLVETTQRKRAEKELLAAEHKRIEEAVAAAHRQVRASSTTQRLLSMPSIWKSDF